MHVSVFDLFAIGIGPSSSHTVGPMKAALDFSQSLQSINLTTLARLQVDLYGSLALTGKGHGTDVAILMGLEGEHPATIDPDSISSRVTRIQQTHCLHLNGHQAIAFNSQEDLVFHYTQSLPRHANALRCLALDAEGHILLEQIYYSIGGGFIVKEGEAEDSQAATALPYPFDTAAELLEHCDRHHLRIHEVMLANEATGRPEAEIKAKLLTIADTMRTCIEKGCATEGVLPGGLHVRRRAAGLYRKLLAKGKPSPGHPDVMNWLNVYAMAVNEENAAGGRIVTAPTNGAAGIVPAVLNYYRNFCDAASTDGIIEFLLTAGAIAILYKKGASISGAEVGCQGEVGVACSMAAGALTAALGGSVRQVEKAAEIGMEHNLGLTCDPIGGLVQIPCIERNAMGAVKAVNAARLVLAEDEDEASDGEHKISLDNVIQTMYHIGKDMMPIYKETSLGGLAKHGGISVNIIEC